MRSWKKHKKNSRFVTKTDVENEPTWTIVEAADEDLAKPGEEAKIKSCIKFKETDKRLAANVTQLAAIDDIIGTEDQDAWPEHQITLYWDPMVMFKGEQTGGIRVRAPKKPFPKLVRKTVTETAPPPAEQEDGEEEMPF